ncbi:MAG TPA: hypothetical protein VF476_14895 [Chitinophagaceae bacterium]
MKYKIILACFLLPIGLLAQDCMKEILRQKAGTWKAGQQGSIANVSAGDLAKEKAVIASIHKLISTNYKPTGCQISYSTVYGKRPGPGQLFIADPYHYAMYILRFLCEPNSKDKSKYYVDYSTPTTVNVTANVIYTLNNLYAANIPTDDSRGYLKLKQRPEKKDGYYYMGEEVVGDGHLENKIKEYRWLITYNDTLPFYYVSRKEYLLIQKKRLEKSIQDSPGEKAYLTQFINNINEYLKKPEAELNKTAICLWNEEERFEKFVEEGTKGSFIAVKPNLAYYRKNLPKSSPQFFCVVYTIAHGDPVFEENIANIKNAIDFAKLKTMLGK